MGHLRPKICYYPAVGVVVLAAGAVALVADAVVADAADLVAGVVAVALAADVVEHLFVVAFAVDAADPVAGAAGHHVAVAFAVSGPDDFVRHDRLHHYLFCQADMEFPPPCFQTLKD